MGMYNELNNISRAVNGQALQLKKTQEQQKQAEYIKSELKSMLQSELMDLDNIFDDDIKATAIENVLSNTIILLYNKEFTRQFLNDKYYIVARQVEQIKKRTSEETNKQQQLKIDILEIKKQQEAEKLKKLQQQNPQREQVQLTQQKNNNLEAIKIILMILFAPIAIFGLILWGVISATAKSK